MMAEIPFAPFRSASARDEYLALYARRAASWPVPSEERFVATSFGETFVRVSGPPEGPPLLMLPGLNSSGLSLGALAGRLSRTRRTFVIDNIHDVGRSVPVRPVKSAEDFTSWLDEVRLGLGLETVDLLGLSLGGWISAQYGLRFPQALKGLVLLAPAGTIEQLPFGFVWRALLCLLPGRKWMHDFMSYAAPELRESAMLRPLMEEMVDDARLGMKLFAARRLVEPRPLSDDDWSRFTPRTFFIAGDREVFFDARAAVEKLAKVCPRVETAVLPGAGHDLFVARAEELAPRIDAFLSSFV